MRTCPTCGEEWPDHAKFCPTDGTPLGPPVEKEAPSKEEASTAESADVADAVARPKVDDDWADGDGDAGDDGFSDTQWFMAAVEEPEALKEEATVDDLTEMQGKYKRDESIPEEVREKFSLRKKKK